MLFAADYLTWVDLKSLITTVVPVIGALWYLSKRFGRLDESLARIEEREKSTHERVVKVEEAQKETQEKVSQLRERVGVVEARSPVNGVSS